MTEAAAAAPAAAPAAPAAAPAPAATPGAVTPEAGSALAPEAASAQSTGDYWADIQSSFEGELNEPVFNEFKAISTRYNLPPEAAKEIFALSAKLEGTPEEQQAAHADAVAAQSNEWLGQLKALPEIGGANFEQSRAVTAKVMALATPELRNFLNTTGLGNHPELFKFIHTIGSKISEGTLINGGHAPAGAGQRKPNAEVFYGSKN